MRSVNEAPTVETPGNGCVNECAATSLQQSPVTSKESVGPNDYRYYNEHLSRNQFNFVMLSCAVNLLKILYPNADEKKLKLRFFVIEVLRRLKTSTHILQIACFYMLKLKKGGHLDRLPQCPKKLFLGLLIIASKFSQDTNFSLKTWLKICGCQNLQVAEVSSNILNIQSLRSLEMQCLQLLGHECYINNMIYENWCNMLMIFGYDVIFYHNEYCNELVWESDSRMVTTKLMKWERFIDDLSFSRLGQFKIDFKSFYLSQYQGKIFVYEDNVSSFLYSKRRFIDYEIRATKKSKIHSL